MVYQDEEVTDSNCKLMPIIFTCFSVTILGTFLNVRNRLSELIEQSNFCFSLIYFDFADYLQKKLSTGFRGHIWQVGTSPFINGLKAESHF